MASDISSSTFSASSILRAMRSVWCRSTPSSPLSRIGSSPKEARCSAPAITPIRMAESRTQSPPRPEGRCRCRWRRTEQLARDGGSAGDLALVEGVLGAHPVARQPRAKKKRGDAAQFGRQLGDRREGEQRRAQRDHRQHEEHVDLRAMAHRLAAAKARHLQPFGRHRLARGVAGALACGAVFSAIAFRHGLEHPESAERGDEDDHAQREKGHTLQKAGTHTIPGVVALVLPSR
jgi:hypothetical protein